MKMRILISAILVTIIATAANAQEIENDDMYFNSKDRAKLKTYQSTLTASNTVSKKQQANQEEENDDVNPTDSYSSREVNPEYSSRSKSQTTQADEEDYFVNDYKYNRQSDFNNFNQNYNTWYGNPWYSNAYWSPSMNSWNTPYYGSAYDPYGNPWANPYYGSGWSSSFSYYWGNSYGYGCNMGYGYSYGNSWGSPWNSYYGGYSPYYNRYNSWGYPTQVVVVDNSNYRGPVYGKRGSRSSAINHDYENGTGRINRGSTNTNGRSSTGGRVLTGSSKQSDYYNRTWRNQTSDNNNNTGSSSGRSSSTWDNSGSGTTRQSNSTYTPSRTSTNSGSNSSSGGSRTNTSSGGSSGSRSGSRGRGN
jgi:hypothetical protein